MIKYRVMAVIKCPKCGDQVREDSKFCPGCGERMPEAQPPDPFQSRTEAAFEEALAKKGRYAIKRLLGRGGMGMVYHAHDSELGIEVAIKSLPAEFSNDPRGLQQLKDEAKMSMQLTHQNIVRLYDLKEALDTKFLVMEYIPGFNLSEYLLVRGKLKEEEAWEILKYVAAALDYAHSQKVIHRDIKPGNILFKTTLTAREFAEHFQQAGKFPEGAEVKVADFGIAKTVSDSMSRISNMAISGTLSYMSREQVRGKHQTHATDIYSLAVVTYEMLAGNPPFHQGEITYQILNEEPEPIPGVKPEYMAAILQALSKNAEDRPASVAEFVSLPEKFRNNPKLMAAAKPQTSPKPKEHVEKQPPSEAAPVKRPFPRWIAGMAVLIVLLTVAILEYRGRTAIAPVETVPPEEPAQPQPEPQPEPVTPEPGPAPAPAPTPAPIAPKVELAWKIGKNSPELAHAGRVNAVALSPSGNILASGGEDKTLKLWNVSTGSLVISVKAHSGAITSIAFSPRGYIVATASHDSKIKLWNASTGAPLTTIDSGIGGINSIAFSRDGNFLASASSTAVKIWKIPGGEPLKTLGGHIGNAANAIAFGPDNNTLATGGAPYVIKIWNVESGKPGESMVGPTFSIINSLAFSPGGNIIASSGTEKTVRVWNASSGKLIRTLDGHAKLVTAVSFSPSGVLATASPDGTIMLWKPSSGPLIQSVENLSGYAISFAKNYLASGGCPDPGASACAIGEVRVYKINL